MAASLSFRNTPDIAPRPASDATVAMQGSDPAEFNAVGRDLRRPLQPLARTNPQRECADSAIRSNRAATFACDGVVRGAAFTSSSRGCSCVARVLAKFRNTASSRRNLLTIRTKDEFGAICDSLARRHSDPRRRSTRGQREDLPNDRIARVSLCSTPFARTADQTSLNSCKAA